MQEEEEKESSSLEKECTLQNQTFFFNLDSQQTIFLLNSPLQPLPLFEILEC